MARYIDVDELLREISFYADRPTKSAMKTIKDLAQHPADVVERKRGKWIDDGKGLYMCSSCGKLWVHWWARIVPPKQMCKELRYCPMCGAEMEETDG